MKKYTANQLWQFVWRADTMEKCFIAEKWLRAHGEMVNEIGGIELWEDLMECISQTCGQICMQERIASYKPKYRAQYQ